MKTKPLAYAIIACFLSLFLWWIGGLDYTVRSFPTAFFIVLTIIATIGVYWSTWGVVKEDMYKEQERLREAKRLLLYDTNDLWVKAGYNKAKFAYLLIEQHERKKAENHETLRNLS